jgi:ATP/maltotriose-dependent transcriptional regulator MalT
VNNLAISLSQQPVQSPLNTELAPGNEKSSQTTGQTPTRAVLLASARSWALQAIATAKKVTGEARTQECDIACVVAMCNLADIVATAGDMDEAKRRYHESLELSQKFGYEAGIAQSKLGLERIAAIPPPKS